MIQALENRFRVEECSFIASSGHSRATGSSPAEKWPRRLRYKLATPLTFTNADICNGHLPQLDIT
ncbi:MAG: hypothetical protein ABR985_16705 [Methanotrichaceae archaeon]